MLRYDLSKIIHPEHMRMIFFKCRQTLFKIAKVGRESPIYFTKMFVNIFTPKLVGISENEE